LIKPLSFAVAVILTLSVGIAVVLQFQSLAMRRRVENKLMAEELARLLCTTSWSPPLSYGLAYDKNGTVEPYNLSMQAWETLQTIDYWEYREQAGVRYGFHLVLHYWVSGHVDYPAYSPYLHYGSSVIPEGAGHIRAYVVVTGSSRWMQGYLEVYAWPEG